MCVGQSYTLSQLSEYYETLLEKLSYIFQGKGSFEIFMETYLGCREVKLVILSLLSGLSSWVYSLDYVFTLA